MTVLRACVPNISDGRNADVVSLDTRDLASTKESARAIREKNGGLAGVEATGLDLAEKGQVQLSMNLVDYHTTSPRQVFDEIARRAAEAGVPVAGSDVVGLTRAAACPEGFAEHTRVIGFDADKPIVERRVAP